MSDVFAWGVGAAEAVLFGIATKLTTRQWLNMDAVVTTLCAASTIPLAMMVQGMETTGVEITPRHGYLSIGYICFLMMPTFSYYWLKDSKDPACNSAILLARDVGFSLAAVVIAYGHFSTNIFNTMHLTYGVLGNVAMACASGYHLYKWGIAKQQGVTSNVDLYLKIDIAISTAIGLWDLLLPRQPFMLLGEYNPDPLSLNLFQAGAGMNLGTAALSYMALSFKSSDDKKAVLKSRMAINALRFACRTYYTVMLEPQSFYVYFLFCLGYVQFFPAYLGIRQKDKV